MYTFYNSPLWITNAPPSLSNDLDALPKSTKKLSCLLFINSHHSLFCNTNKFTLCCSHINYAVREKAAMVERKEGENEEFSSCAPLLNIHIKINF